MKQTESVQPSMINNNFFLFDGNWQRTEKRITKSAESSTNSGFSQYPSHAPHRFHHSPSTRTAQKGHADRGMEKFGIRQNHHHQQNSSDRKFHWATTSFRSFAGQHRASDEVVWNTSKISKSIQSVIYFSHCAKRRCGGNQLA